MTYIKGKYQMDPRLGILSLSPFKELKFLSERIELSIKKISVILPRQEYKLLGKLHRGILGNLESKCFVTIRSQLYNNKKSKVLDAERRERFKNNILACNKNSVVDDLVGMESDIMAAGESLLSL